MSRILETRKKRAELWDRTKAFLDERRGEDGTLSAEDTATYERMEAEVVALGKEVDRLERAEALDREMIRPVSKPLAGKPDAQQEDKPGRASSSYNTAFWRYVRSRAVPYEVRDALEEGVDSEGGYLVPEEFEHTLVQALEEENVFRRLAHVIRTSSGDRKIPVVTSKGTASWVDEEGAIPESDDAFGQTSISAYKLATLVKISEELLGDAAFDMSAYIAKEIARRLGAAEEAAFFGGDGSGKPTGIFAAVGGASAGITAASATAITSDELFDLFYSLRAPYRKKATWVLNDSTVKLIRKLKDSTNNYIWQPSLTAGQPDTLLNRPIVASSYVPEATAGNKALAFGDFGYYWIADRQARSFKRLNELYATTGQVGFLATQRVDGKLILPEAVKVLAMKSA